MNSGLQLQNMLMMLGDVMEQSTASASDARQVQSEFSKLLRQAPQAREVANGLGGMGDRLTDILQKMGALGPGIEAAQGIN